MKRPDIDDDREFDWGRTSSDYAAYRPGYPESFHDLLGVLGVGRNGQSILDLGTGTGVLARALAARGASVTGVDASSSQIAAARELAERNGLENVAFRVCPAESIDAPESAFDAVTAAQSWMYFDSTILIPRLLRTLKADGRLVLTNLLWLPHEDEIAKQSEALVLRHNPQWSSGGYQGGRPHCLDWAEDDFDLQSSHTIRGPLPFTRDTWCGRIRACRGIGASLTKHQVHSFDTEHRKLLETIAPENFGVLHEMTIQAFVRKGTLRQRHTENSDTP